MWLFVLILAVSVIASPLAPPDSITTALLQSSQNLTLPPLPPHIPWQCWGTDLPRLTPTTWEDCLKVAQGMNSLQPEDRPYVTGTPITFGTADIPSNDFVIPMALSSGSCKVRLMPLREKTGEDVTDSMTPRYLAHMIGRMAQMCVVPEPHLGGQGAVGGKGVLALVVAGILKPRRGAAADRRVLIQQGGTREDEDGDDRRDNATRPLLYIPI